MFGFELVRASRHAGRGLFNALAELGAVRMAPPRDPREASHRLAGALGTIARAHDLYVTFDGEIPRGGALVVANHVSYLDPLAILPLCPAAPLAKREVASWPIVGPIGDSLGVVFVDRTTTTGRARALRQIHARLAAGVSVLNFPEGTTTRGDEVRPFLRGGFGIAQRLEVPVVPVAIRYRDPALAWCAETMRARAAAMRTPVSAPRASSLEARGPCASVRRCLARDPWRTAGALARAPRCDGATTRSTEKFISAGGKLQTARRACRQIAWPWSGRSPVADGVTRDASVAVFRRTETRFIDRTRASRV